MPVLPGAGSVFGGTSGACLANNVALRGKDLAGVCRDMIKVDTNGFVHVGEQNVVNTFIDAKDTIKLGVAGVEKVRMFASGGVCLTMATMADPGAGCLALGVTGKIRGDKNGSGALDDILVFSGNVSITLGNGTYNCIVKGGSLTLGASAASDLIFQPGNATAGRWYASGGFAIGTLNDPGASGLGLANAGTIQFRNAGDTGYIQALGMSAGVVRVGTSGASTTVDGAGLTLTAGASGLVLGTSGAVATSFKYSGSIMSNIVGTAGWEFGTGDATAAPADFSFRGANYAPAGVNNNPGGKLRIVGGLGVGNVAQAAVTIEGGQIGASGNAQQAQIELARFNNDQSLSVGTTAALGSSGINCKGKLYVGTPALPALLAGLHVGSAGMAITPISKSANYALVAGDSSMVFGDVSGAGFTFTLPAANAVPAGWFYWFVIIGTSAVNSLTVAPAGADKINNAAASVVKSGYGNGVRLVSDGAANWWQF